MFKVIFINDTSISFIKITLHIYIVKPKIIQTPDIIFDIFFTNGGRTL